MAVAYLRIINNFSPKNSLLIVSRDSLAAKLRELISKKALITGITGQDGSDFLVL
jgi:hypothetical protein